MQKKSKTFFWLLVFCIGLGGGAYAYKTKLVGGQKINVNVEVTHPVISGEMEKLKLYKPRKTMPPLLFMAGLQRTSSLQGFKGEWTLVNMWASWCPPCLTELPSLQRLNDMFAGQGFRVVAISLDTASSPGDIDTIVASRRLGSIARNWDHTGEIFKLVTNNGAIPISFIVDPEGKVFAQLNGEADWASPEAIAFVNSLLGRTKSEGASRF